MEPTLLVIPHYGPDELIHGLFRSTGIRLPDGCLGGQATAIEHAAHPILIVNNRSQNLGFTAACNIGLKRLVQSPPALRYAWILNNDMEFESPEQFGRSLAAMQHCAREHHWAITAQQVRRLDARDQIISGGTMACFPVPRYKSGHRNRGDWSVPSEECWLSFRSVLIHRDLPEKIGLMDTSFISYFGDSDYCLSAREAGFCVGYTGADSFVFHNGDPEAEIGLERQKVKRLDYLSFWRKWIGGPRHAVYLRLMARISSDRLFSVGELRQRARGYPELCTWLATLPEDLHLSSRDIREHFRHQTPLSAFSVLCNLTREMMGGL